VNREKMAIGEYGFIARVVDTEGNMVGLHSRQQPRRGDEHPPTPSPGRNTKIHEPLAER